MSDRLNVHATVVDVQSVRRMTETLPIGLSPWQTIPVAITSVDYIKRADVLAAAGVCRWDLVIVDEAHGVAGDSDRHAAVAALATRAPYVVLLTATPHSGDRQSFVSLCGIGATAGDALLVFRRNRQDVHLGPARRVHRLTVRPNADEVRMHARLADFARAVRQEGRVGHHPDLRDHASRGKGADPDVVLALSVLHKRALSSARSLEYSVARRLATLASPEEPRANQLPLPLSDPAGELTNVDDAPEWSESLSLRNAAHERKLLHRLADAAAAAAQHETKIHAIRRLLRRLREPAIVFTEYRDTLLHLRASLGLPSAVLHGGLTRNDRRVVIEQFTNGTTRLLLATDAAGEGLNLHQTCRIVVNLELPWNPMRLEQRIGRIDRIGQPHTVHVFHLVAGGGSESRILTRLQSRIALARAEIGGPDPLGMPTRAALNTRLETDRGEDQLRAPDLAPEAAVEAERISRSRRFVRNGDDEALATIETRGPSVAIAGHSQTRALLGRRALVVWRVSAEDGAGRTVGSQLVTVAIALPAGPRLARRQIDDILGRRHEELLRCVEHTAAAWRDQLTRIHHGLVGARLAREQAMRAQPAPVDRTGHQPGLFDRRAERAGLAILSAEQARHRAGEEQQLVLDRMKAISFQAPQLLLVLMP